MQLAFKKPRLSLTPSSPAERRSRPDCAIPPAAPGRQLASAPYGSGVNIGRRSGVNLPRWLTMRGVSWRAIPFWRGASNTASIPPTGKGMRQEREPRASRDNQMKTA